MSDPTVLDKLETLTRLVAKLESRVEDLEDDRDLQGAITDNGAKPLVEWSDARRALELD